MSNRKKAEPKQTLNHPFKFADAEQLMEHAGQLANSNYSEGPSTLLAWTHKTYVPAYSLGSIIGGRLNQFTQQGVSSYTMQSHPYFISRCQDVETAKTFDHMWKNGQKNAVFLASVNGVNRLTNTLTEYERVFGLVFDSFIQTGCRMPSPDLPGYFQGVGAAPIVRRFMLGEGVEGTRIVSKKVKTGDFATVNYFANRYFLGYLKPYSTNTAVQQFNNGFIGTNLERNHAVFPLVTLVMKREDVSTVRANWLTEQLMDASMFELWVDKSLDDEDSPHPIRTSYVRSIRNPLAKLGIKVVVKDDLYKECFKGMDVPKFKTLREEKNFIEERTQQILDRERRRLGVQRTPAAAPEPAMQAAMEF